MHMLHMTVEQLIIRCLSEFGLFDINVKHGYNDFCHGLFKSTCMIRQLCLQHIASDLMIIKTESSAHFEGVVGFLMALLIASETGDAGDGVGFILIA